MENFNKQWQNDPSFSIRSQIDRFNLTTDSNINLSVRDFAG